MARGLACSHAGVLARGRSESPSDWARSACSAGS
jgi:hypothetical protein